MIKYLKKPCEQCPFLKSDVQPKNQGWLGEARARGIYESIAAHDNGFPCHKTATLDDDDNTITTGREKQCAGALILQKKQEFLCQPMRILYRLGRLDLESFQDEGKVVDTPEEFITMHRRQGR